MDTGLLQQLISNAAQGKPELPADVLAINGFSAPKVKRLLNALCSQPDVNYLEIGIHLGSTFIPALYGNEAKATCIDHWQMFKGGKDVFDQNVASLLPKRAINVIEGDCFAVSLDRIPQGVNVYFYDGDHGRQAQYDAIAHFAPVLADQFVLVVDDCNWEEPREETKHALNDLGYTTVFDQLLPGEYNGDQDGWWNGLYIALVQK